MKAIILTACSLVASEPALAANDPVPPFAQEKASDGSLLLGYQMERRFSDFMHTCAGVPVPLKMKTSALLGREKDTSSIEQDVIDGLKIRPMDRPIKEALHVSLGRVFGYIYTDAEKISPQWNQNQFLTIDYADEKKVLSPGFPSVRYSATCGGIIEGALHISSDFSFPIATLKGALSADYKSDKTSSLEVASGQFISPLWEMWSLTKPGEARPGDRFYAGMLLWQWWAGRTAGNYNIMTNFSGTLVYHQVSSKSSGSLSGNIDARVSFPIVTASSDVSGSLNKSTTLDIKDFDIFVDVDSPGPSIGFQPVPPVGDAADAVERYAVISDISYDGGQLVQSGQSKTFSFTIDSLPSLFCQKASWLVADDKTSTIGSATLSLVDAGEVKVGEAVSCKMQVNYAPGQISTGADVALRPYLVSTNAAAGRFLHIPLPVTRFSTTEHPSISFVHQQPMTASPRAGSTDKYDITWQIDLKVIDDGKFTQIDQIDPGEIVLACPENTFTAGEPVFSVQLVGLAGPTSRTVRLVGSVEFDGKLDITKIVTTPCKLGGSLLFTPTGGGTPLRRQVPAVQLGYPRVLTATPSTPTP